MIRDVEVGFLRRRVFPPSSCAKCLWHLFACTALSLFHRFFCKPCVPPARNHHPKIMRQRGDGSKAGSTTSLEKLHGQTQTKKTDWRQVTSTNETAQYGGTTCARQGVYTQASDKPNLSTDEEAYPSQHILSGLLVNLCGAWARRDPEVLKKTFGKIQKRGTRYASVGEAVEIQQRSKGLCSVVAEHVALDNDTGAGQAVGSGTGVLSTASRFRQWKWSPADGWCFACFAGSALMRNIPVGVDF